MTQDHVQRKLESAASANRRDFLRALYADAPESLHLELRCIHPTTGKVRTLWGRVGDKRGLAAAFKQADVLNAEGFGLYFAPCLRRERRGRAKSAAWAPALWIDVDDPAQESRLRDFDPAPSFLVSSGGGWHAYWLLDPPMPLDAEADRQRLAGLLRGLSSALGGDPGYVKSAASVMRLPGSVNTKPERGGLVTVAETHPERRHPLSAFAWLEVPPEPTLQPVLALPNGPHPLPPRTLHYLQSGATNGSRNAELFAAACQMRDAGFSQPDAERELVPRFVADGYASENPAAREKEARATVASAYRRPQREPLARARAEVAQLVTRYGRDAAIPSADLVREAVRSCAALDPLDWAEQRDKLKVVGGLRISDVDRLYKEERRAFERQRRAELDDEGYVLRDGRLIHRRETYRGVSERTVADWAATVLHQTSQVDDDGREAHVVALELRRGTAVKRLDVPGEVFVDDSALRRFIGANAGAQFVVRAGMGKHLVPAIVAASGDFPTQRHHSFMGWQQTGERWTYIAPGACVDANGPLSAPPSVSLDARLRDYGLRPVPWEASMAAFTAALEALPAHLAPALIAFAVLPILQRFLPGAATRPALHLVGTSGSGKSEIAALLSSFYGSFSRDAPPAQWGDTVNTVEALGYPLADVLYWVDDYKPVYADERTFTRFLQSYSRGMGRGRLTREAKLRHEKPCRGLILSTGETTLEGEASVLSRMLVLEIPPWEGRDPDGAKLRQALDRRDGLPGFTAHFAAWTAQRLPDDLPGTLARLFGLNITAYQSRLSSPVHDRVLRNWAILQTAYQVLSAFLNQQGAMLPPWRDQVAESARLVREERAGALFLDVLGQLIGSGQAAIDDDMRHPREHAPGVTLIGYREGAFLYILPDVAMRAVSQVQPLKFTAQAVGAQLKEDGLLVPGNASLSVQKRVRGSVVRLWRLRAEALDGIPEV